LPDTAVALAEDPTLPTDIVGAYKMAVREISDLRRENYALKQQLTQLQHVNVVGSAPFSHDLSSQAYSNDGLITVVVQQPYQ